MRVIETERLILREFSIEDAAFILELVNEPSWLRFIGDKGVRTIEDARNYILNVPIKSYKQNGFGLYLVELKNSETSIGMCGLIKRDTLEDIDIGFAFLPKFWGKGYAVESAAAVIEFAKNTLGLKRIVAITSLDNDASAKVLERIGLRFEETIKLSGSDEVKLFARDL